MLRFISHFTYSTLPWSSTPQICLNIWSRTSALEKSSTSWFLACIGFLPGIRMTQSGWVRYRSLSSEIISGSIQIPNFTPRRLMRSINSPRLQPSFSSLTCQSPRPLLSSSRLPNQPSSITTISMPSVAASFASLQIFSPSKSK